MDCRRRSRCPSKPSRSNTWTHATLRARRIDVPPLASHPPGSVDFAAAIASHGGRAYPEGANRFAHVRTSAAGTRDARPRTRGTIMFKRTELSLELTAIDLDDLASVQGGAGWGEFVGRYMGAGVGAVL